MTPNDYDDDSLADHDESPIDEEWEFELDDMILCPRCEEHDTPADHIPCWRCRREIWLHENG